MNENKPRVGIDFWRAIKVLFFVLALIVAYLFALNGRYYPIDDGQIDEYFDKWTKTIMVIERIKEIK